VQGTNLSSVGSIRSAPPRGFPVSSIPQARRRLRGGARVAGGAEEPVLARHIRSSKRRRQDAYATRRRRRTRTRSRRLSLRLQEWLCSPARTPRCRSSSRPTASSSVAGVAGHSGRAEAAEHRPRGRPSAAGVHQFGRCLRLESGGRLCPWVSGKPSWVGVCCVSMTKARFTRTSNQPPKVFDGREIALHEVGRKTRCEQIQWPRLSRQPRPEGAASLRRSSTLRTRPGAHAPSAVAARAVAARFPQMQQPRGDC